MSKEFVEVLVRTSRDAFIVFVGNFLSKLPLAVSVIIVVRLLQPENYGIYSVLVKYVSKFNAKKR